MIHKGCGGSFVLDLSSMYFVNSPSMRITTKGITPGVVQIDELKGGSQALRCKKCSKVLIKKNEMEDGILVECNTCGREYPPSQISVSETTSSIYICDNCSEKVSKNKVVTEEVTLSLYSGLIKKSSFKSLLDILLNK